MLIISQAEKDALLEIARRDGSKEHQIALRALQQYLRKRSMKKPHPLPKPVPIRP